MPTFLAPDGTELAYRVTGTGEPVLCLPGGPMRDSTYLGDLGGLAADLQLVLLDPRGTGQSAVPADLSTYRCDRMSGDVGALADHLGLAGFRLLGHSAGANLAVQYAAAHQDRVSRLALITPSTRAVGLEMTSDDRRAIMELRAGETWYAEAAAAFERAQVDGGTAADWAAMAPLLYGHWDADMQAHWALDADLDNAEAVRMYGSAGAFDPPALRAVLAAYDGDVLLYGGELDINTSPPLVAAYAALFPAASLVVQPGAGHFPWLDDPASFRVAVTSFLAG